jgi:hypothetical protein
MKSCASIFEAEGLSSGFFTKHCSTKSINSGDHLESSRSEGGGFVGIINMARIGCISPYGGLPSAISKAVIPEIQKIYILRQSIHFDNGKSSREYLPKLQISATQS